MFVYLNIGAQKTLALLLFLYRNPDVSDTICKPLLEEVIDTILEKPVFISCTAVLPERSGFKVLHGFVFRSGSHICFRISRTCNYTVDFNSVSSINSSLQKYSSTPQIWPELIPVFVYKSSEWSVVFQRLSIDDFLINNIDGFGFSQFWVGGLAYLYFQAGQILLRFLLDEEILERHTKKVERIYEKVSLFVWFYSGKPLRLQSFLNFTSDNTFGKKEISSLIFHSPYASGYYPVRISKCTDEKLSVLFDDQPQTTWEIYPTKEQLQDLIDVKGKLIGIPRVRTETQWTIGLSVHADNRDVHDWPTYFGLFREFKHDLRFICTSDGCFPFYPLRTSSGNPFSFGTKMAQIEGNPLLLQVMNEAEIYSTKMFSIRNVLQSISRRG